MFLKSLSARPRCVSILCLVQPSVGGTKVMAGLVASARLHPLHISVHRQMEGELSVLPRRRGRWLQGCQHCLLSNGYYLVVYLGGVQIYWERMKNEVNLNFLALNLTGNIEYVCFRNLFPAINLISSTYHKPRQGSPITCA